MMNNSWVRFIFFWVSLAVVGCAAHTPVGNYTGPLPGSFVEAEPEAQPAVAGRWWEIFNDPHLNYLIEEGLKHNNDLAAAYARLAQLKVVAGVTAAAGKPYLTLAANAGRERQPASSSSVTRTTLAGLSVSAGFELDLWQRLRKRTKASLLDAQASREDIRTIYLTLTAQITDLYYLAVEQRAQIALMDAVIKSYDDTLASVKERYREGQSAAGEVYRARRNLVAAKARRPAFEANLAETEHALAILVGRFPEKALSGSLVILPTVPETFAAGLPSDLLARRPDILAASLRIKAKDALVAAAIADRFPSFNLVGEYGRSRVDAASLVVGNFWSLGAGFTQAIIDGGRRRAEVEKSRTVLKQELIGFRRTMLKAFQEVEDALAGNRTTEERLFLLKDQAVVATANADLIRSGYRQGLNDYSSVLEANRQELEIKGQVLSARRQLISDRISLIRSLGGDWMLEVMARREAGEKSGAVIPVIPDKNTVN